MTRKAAAKSSEADAAVLSRAAGLDQRLRMSASVAGLPSIYAATARLSFFVRSRRRALGCSEILSAAMSAPWLLQAVSMLPLALMRLYEQRAVFCARRFAFHTAV